MNQGGLRTSDFPDQSEQVLEMIPRWRI